MKKKALFTKKLLKVRVHIRKIAVCNTGFPIADEVGLFKPALKAGLPSLMDELRVT